MISINVLGFYFCLLFSSTAAFSSSLSYSSPLSYASHHSNPRTSSRPSPNSPVSYLTKNKQVQKHRLPFFSSAHLKLHQTKENDDTTPTITSTISLLESVNLNIPSYDYAKRFYGDLLGCSPDPKDEERDDDDICMCCASTPSTSKSSYFRLTHQANIKNNSKKGTTSSTLAPTLYAVSIGLNFDNLEGLKNHLEDEQNRNQDGDDIAIEDYEFGIDERTQREYIRIVEPYTNTIFYARTTSAPEAANNAGDDDKNIVSTCLGINYIEFTVRPNLSPMISQFYEGIFDVPTTIVQNEKEEKIVIVGCGAIDVGTGQCNQSLLFRECKQPPQSSSLSPKIGISLCCDGSTDDINDGEYEDDYRQVLSHCKMADIVLGSKTQQEQQQQDQSFCFDDVLDLRTGRTILKLNHEILSK